MYRSLYRASGALAAIDAGLTPILQSVPNTPDRHARSQLLYHRNTYSPVNGLPTEILQGVFRLTVDAAHGAGTRKTRQILVLSWTCSHWRALAVGDPQLWRYIDLRSKDLARLFARRCEPCTLAIDLHREWYSRSRYRVDDLDERFAFCTENLARVGALYCQPLLMELPAWMLERPAPRLEELSVVTMHRASNVYSSLFGDRAPQLRTLEMSGCRPAWRPGMYRNLRRLKVEFHSIMAHPDKDEDLLAILECPSLESLELKLTDDRVGRWDPSTNILLPATLYTEAKHERIEVPALRSLVLDLPSEYMLHIMQSIALPQELTRLSLKARADNDLLTGLLVSTRCLPSYLSRRFRELSILHKFQLDNTISCGLQGVGRTADGNRLDVSLTVVPLRDDERSLRIEPIISTLCSEHPLPNLVELNLEGSNRINAEARTAAAAHMVSLISHCSSTISELSLSGCKGSLLRGIYERAAKVTDDASVRCPLQNLKALCVTSMAPTMEEFTNLMSLCRLLSGRLHTLLISGLSFTVNSKKDSMELVKMFAELDVPEKQWAKTQFWCEADEDWCDIRQLC